jgi:hypothetical protein
MADQIIARRWLIDLGRLTLAKGTPDDADDFIETMAPMLAMRFPNEIFTAVSLEYVAAECKFLPTYGELVALLRDWKRQLPAPSYPAINDNVVGLSPEGRQWLRYFQAREAEGFAPLREPDGRLSRPEITDWREHTLSLLHQHAPDVWYYLQRDHYAA